MPDAITIIRDQKRHLIQRLVTRSPLLRFLPGSYREDVCTLFQDIIPNIPRVYRENSRSPNTSSSPLELLNSLFSKNPQPSILLNPKKSPIAKCRKIRQEAEENLHTTGQDSLYIGYPLIFNPIEGGRFILAPLFLWPIALTVKTDHILFDRLRNEDEKLPEEIFAPPSEARFNRIFKAWLSHETGIELVWEDGKEEEITLKTLSTQINNILKPWHQCEKRFLGSSINPLPPNPQAYFKSLSEKGQSPTVIESAVLGLASFKGQALLNDLDQLEKKLQDDPGNCGLLKYFLFPRNSQLDNPASIPEEDNKWLITNSDHSQESAIWQARKSDLMILQGPPGTGKSQTIVNLIADALQNKKKVLVLCQKRAALEVVLKRMRAVGLGELGELIDEPSKDRAKVIRAIKAIDTDLALPRSNMNRNQISTDLISYEKQLDNQTTGLNDTKNETRHRYSNLLAILHLIKSDKDIHILRDFLTFYERFCKHTAINTIEELERNQAELKNFKVLYQQCGYRENSWRRVTKKAISQTDLDTISGCLYKIINIARNLEIVSDKSFHTEDVSWLAEHPWATPYYALFLSEPLRENQRQFHELISYTRILMQWLPEDLISVLINNVRHSSEGSSYYQKLLDDTSWISTICDVNQLFEQNKVLGLLHERGNRSIDSWAEIISAATAQYWLNDIEKQYNMKTPQEMERMRNSLKDLLTKKREMDRAGIISHYKYRFSPVNNLADSGLLRLRRSRFAPHTSLRKLYVSGFDSLHMLRPVLLTNPETASSILELTPGLYDLVIIDEASQMFMADSLPILFRAKAAMISGDGMQMPPSDFFLSGISDSDQDIEEDDDDDYLNKVNTERLIAADGEYCLLDAAEHAAQVGSPNKKRLFVHYRSEFRELIDFSNHAFYDGKLIIPSGNLGKPFGLYSPIELHQVSGRFIKSENEIEANKVVQKLKDLWSNKNSPSVGVIAFNVKQKNKILDLLFEEATNDTEFAQRLADERARRTPDGEDIGFFVRSVEHVQGDERDIIILSTTYDGTSRNFGPISKREKGRRRFNVAITRARLGMVIISSLNIDFISNESERENSESYFFWKYMCYARAIDRGNREEADQILTSLLANSEKQKEAANAVPDSLFEIQVADFLREKGFHVEYQIGESGFQIDLGVKRSAKDHRFICGIECDGRQYHSSWTARLNDIWRQDILKEKGWRIIRIWGTDWFSNQNHTKTTLLNKLNTPD